MCGLAGTINIPKELAAKSMSKMLAQQAHRGPDATGFWQDDKCALGHNRLAIIDLDTHANQPMHSHNGRYVMVFNGEIYNYKAIQQELVEVQWKTQSDSEVLLEAYVKWGAACLDKLNGMFAFAIWDKQEESLFIARDRLGIKPLYYSIKDGSLLFASELRTLLKSDLVDARVNLQSVHDFIRFQWVQTPDTIIQAISSVPAGHFATYSDNTWQTQAWWDINKLTKNEETTDLKKAQQKVKTLFYEAVERRMISDVPIGAFLSGGIDSSAVVAAMSNISSTPIDTFSIGFAEKKYDESAYAAIIAKKFNTNHHPLEYSAKAMQQDVPEILGTFDTPSADGVNSYVVSKLVKEAGITVALSGLGGDELFCGYPVFTQLPKIQQIPLAWKLPTSIRKMAASPLSLLPDQKWKKLGMMLKEKSNDPTHLYPYFREINSQSQTASWIKPTITHSLFEDSLQNIRAKGTLSWLSVAETTGYTQHVLLKDTDMCSMTHALEVRVPFFDYTLVEYVNQLSDNLKTPTTPKKLLTDALAEELPMEIINRPKMGFSFPWDIWLRNDLKSFVEHQLVKAKQFDFLNEPAIQASWQQYIQGNKNIKWYQIWNLVCLIDWLDKNIKPN